MYPPQMRPTPVFHHACPAHFYYAIDMMGAKEGKREGNISPRKVMNFSPCVLPLPPYQLLPVMALHGGRSFRERQETEFKKSENAWTAAVYVANCVKPLPVLCLFFFFPLGGNKENNTTSVIMLTPCVLFLVYCCPPLHTGLQAFFKFRFVSWGSLSWKRFFHVCFARTFPAYAAFQ